MLKMSVELLLENVEKPWANLRVNDLVVDGNLTVTGAVNKPGGIIAGLSAAPAVTSMGIGGAFYEINMTGANLTSGALTDFAASNLNGVGPRLTYTGTDPTVINVFYAISVQKAVAASYMECIVTKNGVGVIGGEGYENYILNTSYTQMVGACTRLPVVNGDVIRLFISSADANNCQVDAFNLQVY